MPNISKSQVLFIVGTRAEIIKVQPVISDLNLYSVKPHLLWVGLHAPIATAPLDPLVTQSRLSIEDHEDKKDIRKVAIWFVKSSWRIGKLAIQARIRKTKPALVVVHGDTLCTLLGTFFGVLAAVPVAHIEACVRSGALFRPFPEEISRRIVSKFAAINFTPGNREYGLASNYRGKRVNTFHNTSRDALYRKLSKDQYFDGGNVLVTLHRAELLSKKFVMERTVDEIVELSVKRRVFWFMGEHERDALSNLDLMGKIELSNVVIKPRQNHDEFIELVAVAHCVITDSHGLQYECQDLGVPVVVHRCETEYLDNKDSHWTLTKWKEGAIGAFVDGLSGHSKEPRGRKYPAVASTLIAKTILELSRESTGSDEEN